MNKLFLGLAAFLFFAMSGFSQTASGRLAAKIVGGKVVVQCDLSSNTRRVPVNLIVELESSSAFFLQDTAARDLGFDGSVDATLHFPGFKVAGLAPDVGASDFHKFFTNRYAPELSETLCVGTLGAEFFERFQVVFELGEGFIALNPKVAEAEPGFEWRDGSVPMEQSGSLWWLDVTYAGDQESKMAIGTGSIDTTIASDLCQELGFPAGNIGSFTVGGLELSDRVALRPEALDEFHPDGAFGRLGTNVLTQTRLTLDFVNGRASFAAVKPAVFPQDDLAFFLARAAEDATKIEKFLVDFPEARLKEEAARLLLQMRLEEHINGGGDDSVARALLFVHQATPKDLRATQALKTMDLLEKQGATALVIKAGELGVSSGKDDRDPLATYKIHGRLGRIHFDEGREDPAFKHLFSAVFGMREDGPANLDLGRYYEKQKRYRRAFSRFVQAVVKEETAEAALAGMKRCQKHLDSSEAMSIEVIEKLVAGRIPAFRVASRYKVKKGEKKPTRHVLLELMTGAHCGPCIAADLAFEAVDSFFPETVLSLIQYHVHIPAPDPLANPTSTRAFRLLGGTAAPQAFIDGHVRINGGGREGDKEKKYEQYKEAILKALEVKSDHTISTTTTIDQGKVTGEATISGPVGSGMPHVQVLLVEKSVLFPGRNKIVIHRMVVRSELTGTSAGIPYLPKDGKMVVKFSVKLADIQSDLEDHLDQVESQQGSQFTMWPTTIDPKQVSIVVILRDLESEQVLQSDQSDPTFPAEELK